MAHSKCCQSYALVLMDMNMPVMDGMAATKQITQLVNEGKLPPQKVVALTGDCIEKENEEAMKRDAGFVAYYTKPLSKQTFAEIMKKFCVE